MNKKIIFFQPIFYIGFVAYFILGYMTLAFGERVANAMYPEDHYFENVGAISLFIAFGICLYIFIYSRRTSKITGTFWVKQLVYLGLAMLFFFGGGEEISWGQRIFNIAEPPTLAQQNTQNELNIHNLKIFENSRLLKADNIFTVFWFGFAVILPALSLLSERFKKFASKLVPIPFWGLGALFLFNYIWAGLSKIIYISTYTYQEISFVQAVQEVKESNYELLFVPLALFILWELKGRIRETSG